MYHHVFRPEAAYVALKVKQITYGKRSRFRSLLCSGPWTTSHGIQPMEDGKAVFRSAPHRESNSRNAQ